MFTDRAFPFRRWFEVIAWLGLGALSVALLILPLSDSRRTSFALFLVFLVFYVVYTFRILFPRTSYAPRVIFSTLVIDVFIVGALHLVLADYFPNYELAFVPLIALAATVASWHGVLALALFAEFVDLVTQVRLITLPRETFSLSILMNQLFMAATFAVTGLVVLALVEVIRRRVDESTQAALHATDIERQEREQAERSARRWELLNAVGVQVQAESGPPQIFQVIGDQLRSLGLECVIGLWDGPPCKSVQLEYVSFVPALMQTLERLTGFKQADIRLDFRAIPGFEQSAAEHRALYVEPTADMIRQIAPQVPAPAFSGMASLIGLHHLILVPLSARDQAQGVFAVWGRDLDRADVPAITGLAQQIAIALERARLLEREQKRASQSIVVNEMATRAVGLLNVDELLNEITRMIVERLGFENASVLLSESSTRSVTLRAHAGTAINLQEIGYRQSWDVGLIGAAARTGKTVLVNDVQGDPRYLTADPKQDVCHAEICVPLKRGVESLGVLDVESTKVNAFDSSDVATLETLANQVAMAIEKGEMFASERKRSAQLALVSVIAERITAILDPDRLLDEVVRLTREQFGYHNVAILTLDPGENFLRLRAVSGEYADLFHLSYQQDLRVGLIGSAALIGTAVVANDVRQDVRFYFPGTREPVTGSEMSVPLRMGNKVLGVLDIQTRNVNAFDASDIAAMETLANQVAIACENARLYAHTKSEAEVKATLLRELSHRVKNNLAAIVGLLYLGLDDETISREEVLTETLTRVQSMAVAHTVLANSPQARADVLDLARRVLSDTVRQLVLPGQNVPFSVQGEALDISAHQAATVALVLNELVTNAIKHGNGQDCGELCLTVRIVGGQVRLEFFSEGNQLPNEILGNPDAGGLGLQLVRTLVQKDLQGTFVMSARDKPRGVLNVICFEPEK